MSISDREFYVNKPKPKSKEEHMADFWYSFYESIEKANGSVQHWKPQTTLLEVAENLAQNGVRFIFDRNTMKG